MRTLFYLLLCSSLLLLGCQKKVLLDDLFKEKIKNASLVSPKYLALGDSYTKAQGIDINQGYPNQLKDTLNKLPYIQFKETRIIAQTGWTTQNLLSTINAEQFDYPYDLVTLLIGVNNLYQGIPISTYEYEFKECLKKAVSLAGNNKSKVLVISIPDYGYTPFGAQYQAAISEGIDRYNNLNKQITDSMGVEYINITPISRSFDETLVCSDNLHPSARQYQLWVESMYEKVRLKLINPN